MGHIAPGQDYALPLVKVGKSKLKVQPDRMWVHRSEGIGTNSMGQRALDTSGPTQKPWKTS